MSTTYTKTDDRLAAPPPHRKHLPIVCPEGIPDDNFLQGVRAILASHQLTTGARVREFEETAAAYLGVPHCVAVSSCTAGLLLTLRALDLRGDVIVPSFTFHATAHSVLWNGLRPIFADCNEQTFCIDPDAVKQKLSAATAAVLAVHLFGCPVEVSSLEKICGNYGIPLICDAAHAFGCKVGARHVGTFGAAEIFSFSPTKLLVAGEGGMVATRDAALAQRLRAARNYGDAGDANPELLGLNARMSEFHAALALNGFSGLEARIDRRNAIRRLYVRRLKSVPGIAFQQIPEGHRSSWKDMSVLVEECAFGLSRDALQRFLAERNIETRRYFWPAVHQQKLYRDIWDRQPLPVSERVSRRVLNLPIYSSLSDEDVNRVCDAVLQASELGQNPSTLHEVKKNTGNPSRPFQPLPAPAPEGTL
jgi:dTDP-4-amino-4,6-dideoxygalactose transaminase